MFFFSFHLFSVFGSTNTTRILNSSEVVKMLKGNEPPGRDGFKIPFFYLGLKSFVQNELGVGFNPEKNDVLWSESNNNWIFSLRRSCFPIFSKNCYIM